MFYIGYHVWLISPISTVVSWNYLTVFKPIAVCHWRYTVLIQADICMQWAAENYREC